MTASTNLVAIIGAGPAGMAAALQLHRFGVGALLFEQNPKKSLLNNAWRVENYLGYYPGKTGIKLLQAFQAHIAKCQINTIKTPVALLDYCRKKQAFKIKTSTTTYTAQHVIIASGTKPKLLSSSSNFKQPIKVTKTTKNIHYEVFPLLKKRNKTILIIGAGDAAFDNALNLVSHNKVIICNRTKTIKALPLLVNKALKHHKISYFHNYKLQQIFSDKPLSGKISVVFTNHRKKVYIEADYLLVAIGRVPQKDFYTSKLHNMEKRLISSSKMFLVGDVNNQIYRQVAIAVGDGIKAAMLIYHSLNRI